MRRPRALLVLVAAAFAAAVAHADIDDGIAYFKVGKIQEAAAAFQQSVDENPADDRAWFLLAQCLRFMGRPAESERALSQAVLARPDCAEYRHALALALRDGGRPREAIAEAAEALRTADSPRTVYALHVVLGAALGDLERWREAVVEFERARALKSDSALLDLLGRAYFALGDDSRAVAAWSEAQARDPGDGTRLRLVVESFLRAGLRASEPAEKREAYHRALELARTYVRGREDDPDASHLLGRAALGAGFLDEAEGAFRRVLAVRPRHCYALANLGRVLLAEDERDVAERYLLRASACAPRLGSVYESLGALWLVEGRFSQAAQAFARAMRFEPSPTAAAGLREAQRRIGVMPEEGTMQVPVRGR